MRIPDEVRKCVAFVGCNTEKGMRWGGTAFFVGVPTSRAGVQVHYLVTAKHVIQKIAEEGSDHQVYLRINKKDNTAEVIKVPVSSWRFHPDDLSSDAAVVSVSIPDADYLLVLDDTAISNELLKKMDIGVGDEIFLTGLFVSHIGMQRNIPIVRRGTIAAMPGQQIETNMGPMEAYLVEVRSIGGLSGSPVFVHLGPVRINPQTGHYQMLQNDNFYWLGLMHGHWNVKPSHVAQDSPGEEAVNMGIAIVVPSSKILEVINQPMYVEARKKWEEDLLAGKV